MKHVPVKQVIAPCVGVICFRGEDVLLIRRGKPPRFGEWSIPGGRIEFGETAERAALRELYEETSVTAKLYGLVDVIDGFFGKTNTAHLEKHYLLCDYVAQWQAGVPVAGDDAADARFVSPDALQTLRLWEKTRAVIETGRRMITETQNKA